MLGITRSCRSSNLTLSLPYKRSIPLLTGGFSMRVVFMLPLLLLTGCARFAERVLNAQTASDKLRSELGADIDLQQALRKDVAGKNAEVEFVSYGTYSCGPDTADYAAIRVYNRNPVTAREQAEIIKKAKKGKLDYLRNKYAEFETIMAYGEALSATTKDRDERVKAYNNLKTLSWIRSFQANLLLS